MTRPQILMTIRDRNVTVFTCDAPDCKWSRLAIGTPVSTEREALEHLKTHDKEDRVGELHLWSQDLPAFLAMCGHKERACDHRQCPPDKCQGC